MLRGAMLITRIEFCDDKLLKGGLNTAGHALTSDGCSPRTVFRAHAIERHNGAN